MSNLTLEDFNTNFITEICNIEEGHTDETGTFDYGVGFHVLCKPNMRVMYFEDHLNSNILPPGFAEGEIVNAAWSNLLPTVKTWAEGAITAPSLLGATYTPNSNLEFTNVVDFSLADFNSNYTTQIARFDTYPKIEPSSWCVGLNVIRNANPSDSMYIDTNVYVTTFALSKTEDGRLCLAHRMQSVNISRWEYLD